MPNTTSSKITPLQIIIVSTAILIAGATWGWYRLVYTSPSAVFDRMLYNTLSINGFYKNVSQTAPGQPPIKQHTLAITSPVQRARSVVVLNQGPDGNTVITTESIGTTEADYVRYTDFKTNEKTAQGKDFDFSSVLGVWGKTNTNDPYSAGAELYRQNVLDVLPIGNVTANQRQELIKQIKDSQVYAVDYDNVKKSSNAGRPTYTYNVKLKMDAYVSLLKAFVHDIGLKYEQLESVDPASYSNSAPLNFRFEVDILSGQVIKITYLDSSSQTETFGSYGIRPQIDIPTQYIPVSELESRLQQIQ